MRDDPSQNDSFKQLGSWDVQKYSDQIYVPHKSSSNPLRRQFNFSSNSLSGNERNRLFLRHNDNFSDVTLVSGVDSLKDARSFALLDFDQDGWQDIALMSLNFPKFKLYRNRLQQIYPKRSALRLKLIGGQTAPTSDTKLSNRDAIGAQVLVEFKSGKQVRLQKQRGQGFASQNSEILCLGIPVEDKVAKLTVDWPSGIETVVDSPETDKVLTIREGSNGN